MPEMTGRKTRYKDLIKIGPPKLTAYERARIIGIRAVQIDYGADPFIEAKEGMSSIEIAEKELESGILPLSIRRKLIYKDESEFEPIPVKWLLMAEKEDREVEI